MTALNNKGKIRVKVIPWVMYAFQQQPQHTNMIIQVASNLTSAVRYYGDTRNYRCPLTKMKMLFFQLDFMILFYDANFDDGLATKMSRDKKINDENWKCSQTHTEMDAA